MSIELSNYIKSLPKEYDENYSLIINSDNVIVAVILKKLINDNVIRNLYKKELGKKLIAVKLNFNNESPDELIGVGASWAYSFTEDAIMKAVRTA